MVSRRRLHLFIVLLLPLMTLRALLPAGFMPVAEGGELRMVMCGDGLQLPGNVGDDDTGHPAPSDTGDCPFAHGSINAPPVQHVAGIVEPRREVRFLALAVDELPPATGPPRIAAARAPPVLS